MVVVAAIALFWSSLRNPAIVGKYHTVLALLWL
jgi:hypothetical protein